jgi:MSHA biogenesis protein MshE
MAIARTKLRIGDLLLQKKLITSTQLEMGLRSQIESNKKLGELLVDDGIVTEDALLLALSEQLALPIIDLADYTLDTSLSRKLPESYARRFDAVLLKVENGRALIGMNDPLDIVATDEIARILEMDIDVAIVRKAGLQISLDLLYRRTDDISGFAQKLDEEFSDDDDVDLASLESMSADDAPVIKLLRSIFEDAVQVGASDIHIEPDEKVVHVRLRVDGVLQQQTLENARIIGAVSQRLKLMSGLNIAERRLPQDGRFRIRIRGQRIDVRLSTLPIQDGESIVMRLLNQSKGILNLKTLGMPNAILKNLNRILRYPHGMLLVTGPTGSGKTTTLYAALNALNEESVKIISIEDPVEYRLSGINQVQVKPKIGLDFSRVLRTCLRQDPDIMLVGEMRDHETAEIAIRAALTGHLVLSTLHTNDAHSAATRLIDMGVKGYLVASTIRGVLAQRLVRRVCESCALDYVPTEQEQLWLDSTFGVAAAAWAFKKGKGCIRCNKTGFRGRVGVYELLEFSQPMLEALREDNTAEYTRLAEADTDIVTLMQSAIALASQGVTTLGEVLRVAGGGE